MGWQRVRHNWATLTGVGCHPFLQGICPTQGLNSGLPHCGQILYCLSHQKSPRILKWVAYPFSRVSSQPRNWTGVSCIANGFLTSWATREALWGRKRVEHNLGTKQQQQIDLWLLLSSCSVVSDSLWPHGLQHARLPCPSPTPRACSNSCPFSQWCHPAISSSFIPFSFCLQSFPASGSFLMSRLFAPGGQSIGTSASVLSINVLGLISFRINWLDLLAVQGTLKSLLQHHNSKASIFGAQLSL